MKMFPCVLCLLVLLACAAPTQANGYGTALVNTCAPAAVAVPVAVPYPVAVQTIQTGIGSSAFLLNSQTNLNFLRVNSFSAGAGAGPSITQVETRRGLLGRRSTRVTVVR